MKYSNFIAAVAVIFAASCGGLPERHAPEESGYSDYTDNTDYTAPTEIETSGPCNINIAEGYYSYASSSYSCGSGYIEIKKTEGGLIMNGTAVTLYGDCSIYVPTSGCYGTILENEISMTCDGCIYEALPMLIETRRELGVYTDDYYSWGNCTSPFGKTIRLFITDAYFDANGHIAKITDTTKLEVLDSGGTQIFSTGLNSDGTMQFTYNEETVDAQLDPFKLPMSTTPHFDVLFLTAKCSYVYSP